ncbi:glycosyltransferase family 2 protein [Riemerella anatipestifer]|nr:glycosyltransferase family 2 protein [Riemerella anatipestifer]
MDVGQGENPLISVIVPVYNAENYVEECLRSISNQTYRNIEIIVINDGSTDSSGAICDRYAMTDSRVRVIHKSNGGLSNTRNVGIENAKGEYISFVDNDDIVHPQFLEVLYRLQYFIGADIVCCKYCRFFNSEEISKNSHYIMKFDTSSPYLKTIPFETFNKYTFFKTIYNKDYSVTNVVVWNKLYKRTVFSGIKFREDVFNDDEFLFNDLYGSRTSEDVKIVYLHNAVLYFYRNTPNSMINTEITLERKLSLNRLYLERIILFRARGNKPDYHMAERRSIEFMKKMLREGFARALVKNLTVNDYKLILSATFLKVIERVKLVVLIFYKALLNK